MSDSVMSGFDISRQEDLRLRGWFATNMCDCAASQLTANDDADPDFISVDSDSISMQGSPSPGASTIEFDLPIEHGITREELSTLQRGLTSWEVHDLKRLGYSIQHIREHFPEVADIHDRGPQAIEYISRPRERCSRCLKDRADEVGEAISKGIVHLCNTCSLPLVRHEHTFESISSTDLSLCFCYCACSKEQPDYSNDPIWLPFFTRLGGLTPSPAASIFLQKNGFCFRDELSERFRAAVQTSTHIPSYREVITNTVPDHITLSRTDYLASRWSELVNAHQFPNGILCSRETDSGLPAVLENAMLYSDPNAFGHVSRLKYELQGPDISDIQELSAENLHKWNQIADLLHQREQLAGSSRENGTWFAVWAAEFEEDFGLGDKDSDSSCSVDDMGEEAWRASTLSEAEQCPCGDLERCVQRHHRRRHMERKLERIAHRGGYPLLPNDVQIAAAAVHNYEDYVEKAGLDHLIVAPQWQRFQRGPSLCDSSEADDQSDILDDDNAEGHNGQQPQESAARPPTLPPIIQHQAVNDFTNAMAAYANASGSSLSPSLHNGGQVSAFSDDSDDETEIEEESIDWENSIRPPPVAPASDDEIANDPVNALEVFRQSLDRAFVTGSITQRQASALYAMLRSHVIDPDEDVAGQISWNGSGQGRSDASRRRRST